VRTRLVKYTFPVRVSTLDFSPVLIEERGLAVMRLRELIGSARVGESAANAVVGVLTGAAWRK